MEAIKDQILKWYCRRNLDCKVKAHWFPKDNSSLSDKVNRCLIFLGSKNQMGTK